MNYKFGFRRKFKNRQKPPCPLCKKSDRVIPIHYGQPTAEMFLSSLEGKVLIRKVKRTSNNWFCRRDGKGFSNNPRKKQRF